MLSAKLLSTQVFEAANVLADGGGRNRMERGRGGGEGEQAGAAAAAAATAASKQGRMQGRKQQQQQQASKQASSRSDRWGGPGGGGGYIRGSASSGTIIFSLNLHNTYVFVNYADV